jgi:hypothetical protein
VVGSLLDVTGKVDLELFLQMKVRYTCTVVKNLNCV